MVFNTILNSKNVDESQDLDLEQFNSKKSQNMLVAQAYYQLSKQAADLVKKSKRAKECGSYLLFNVSKKTLERILFLANFCKIRLCPMCQWRRSLLVFGQTRAVAQELRKRNPKIRFLMLTLTIRSVKAEKLPETLDKMRLGFNRLMKRQIVDRVVKGFFRSLEVTYNKEEDTYHPHLHIVLAVPSHYFDHYYINHASWLQLWRDCYRDQSIQNVNLKTLKPNPKRKKATIEDSVAETCKYATKPTDYIGKGTVNLKVFQTLDSCLSGRRLIGYGKEFKKLHAELFPRNQAKASNEELIKGENVGKSEESEEEEEFFQELYKWRIGASHYSREL